MAQPAVQSGTGEQLFPQQALQKTCRRVQNGKSEYGGQDADDRKSEAADSEIGEHRVQPWPQVFAFGSPQRQHCEKTGQDVD